MLSPEWMKGSSLPSSHVHCVKEGAQGIAGKEEKCSKTQALPRTLG